jgi:large subunit ribosomal protein L5
MAKAPAAPQKPQAGGKAPAGKAQQQPKRAAKGGAPAPATPQGRPKPTGDVPARLKDRFATTILPALMKERGYTNPWQTPRLHKIVISMGVGEARDNAKIMDFAVSDLQTISGQKPLITKAKKSIANFKLRENVPIGAKVTLRGARMYEFLDRLVNVALPRVRDFKGVPPKGFDGRGNYAMGLREQLIFPEIVYDKIDKVRGMDINIVTTARTDEDAKALLQHLGMPFRES